jgi:hypothetical protein
MKYEIKNRFSGAVQFTAEIECDENASTAIKLGLAVMWAIKTRADLARANLVGANLARAYLVGADLARADLARADLARANLGDQWLIQGSTRSDGYEFLLMRLTDSTEPMIRAGCRYFTVPVAIKHWNETRKGTPLGDESIAIVNHLVELARIRGLK